MAQTPTTSERFSAGAEALVERAGQVGAAGWRQTRDIGAPLAPLLVGAAVGLAAYALFSRAAPQRRRHPRPGYDDVIARLNHLIAICHDGEEGFRTSADALTDVATKELFQHAANRCAQGAAELKRHVRRLGGTPEEIGTVSGAAHRGWVNLKAAVTGRDERAILGEVERGEDVAKIAYEKALAGGLPPNIRRVLHRQLEGVRRNHDKVRNLRNAARAAAG